MSLALQDDLMLMAEAARLAGALIRDGFGQDVETWSKGAAGPVTAVDLAANAAIEALLRPARPAYGWLSEETPDDDARLSCSHVFHIDPLDGTQAFLDKKRECAVSIGLSIDGAPVAGVVYNPLTEEFFEGAVGQGATLNGAPIQVSACQALAGATLIGRPGWFTASFWPIPWPPVAPLFKHSIAYRMALVAAGAADGAALLGYKHDWDIAAGSAIVLAAGGQLTTPWGEPICLNSAESRSPGVVIAGPTLHPLLCAQVAGTTHPREWAAIAATRAKDSGS